MGATAIDLIDLTDLDGISTDEPAGADAPTRAGIWCADAMAHARDAKDLCQILARAAGDSDLKAGIGYLWSELDALGDMLEDLTTGENGLAVVDRER